MLVSHLYKFIFLKSLKTAGTSTEVFLEQYCISNITEDHKREAIATEEGIIGKRGKNGTSTTAYGEYWNHMKAGVLRESLGSEIFDNYTKVINVRNPFDMLVSNYFFKPFYDVYSKGAILTFKEFIMTTNILVELTDKHNRFMFIDGNFIIDEAIRYENLENDINGLISKLEMPPSQRSLGYYKKSKKRDDSIHYSTMYDSETREFVEEGMKDYLERFDYKFENN
jgi:hypothetical protein